MRKYLLLLLIIVLLQGANTPGPDSPSGLMTEFIRDPSGVAIMDLKPEFSWIVPSGAKEQSAYQILVASGQENLARDFGDIWDSRKIAGNRSAEMEYGGDNLKKNTPYCWKVRIWSDSDKPSAWSAIQSFRTGAPEGYQTTRNRFQIIPIEPEKLIKIADNHYFADFGKDAFGTLELDLKIVTDDTIIIHLGEKISWTNRIDRTPGGSIRYQMVKLPVRAGENKYTLKLPKDVRNTGAAAVLLPDSMGVVTPFRYCEIERCPIDLKPENIHQKTLWYFFDDGQSSFSSSDTVLNKVWEICKYSMKATSFAGLYVDGDRERIPYEADAYINQLGHYYTDREYSIGRLTNEYFIKHPTWPTEWILHTVPMFYYDFMYTGNIESVKNYYPELKHKTLLALAREDGLISSKRSTDEIMKSLGFSSPKERLRDIVDWPPSQKDTGWKLVTPEGERDGYEMVDINTVVNAFYYNSLRLMSELAGWLGKKEDQTFYSEEALRVKGAFNRIFLDKKSGIYTDGESSKHSSLHANMMALAFSLVPEENIKTVTAFIKSRGMACSVYGAQYLLEGLYRAGEEDYALSLMTATSDRSWYNMIKAGSTITLEAWDMKYKPNSDWNHAWGAAPANIIPRFMWGISPGEPGYARAIIKPQTGSLKQSKISVPTIRGNIEAEFNDWGKEKEYSINIPGNMECDFMITDPGNIVVLLNGKKINNGLKKIELKPGLNKIEIR